MNVQDVLAVALIEDNIVRLPSGNNDDSLKFKAGKMLTEIGGTWKGGKIQGWVFKNMPPQLLDKVKQVQAGIFKRHVALLDTPASVAIQMINKAEMYDDDLVLGCSAQRGGILQVVHDQHPKLVIDYCEWLITHESVKAGLSNYRTVTDDVLSYNPGEVYDVILAHPSLEKYMDVDHITHLYKLLKPGGRLVSIASNRWVANGQKLKEQKFKYFLQNRNATIDDMPAGTFHKNGINFPACLIQLDKPVN